MALNKMLTTGLPNAITHRLLLTSAAPRQVPPLLKSGVLLLVPTQVVIGL